MELGSHLTEETLIWPLFKITASPLYRVALEPFPSSLSELPAPSFSPNPGHPLYSYKNDLLTEINLLLHLPFS